MKILKITLVAVISSFLMVLPSSAVEKRIGVAVGFTSVQAEGTETLKDTGVKSDSDAGAHVAIPSIFAELAADNGFGLGIEHVPGSADINSKTRSRTLDHAGLGNDSGSNKASAEIDGLTSVYLIKTFQSGFFVKAGQTSTTVKTKEVLGTGSTYKDVMFGLNDRSEMGSDVLLNRFTMNRFNVMVNPARKHVITTKYTLDK